MNKTTSIAAATNTCKPGWTTAQGDATRGDVVQLRASLPMPLPGSEGFRTSGGLLDHHHNDARLTVGNGRSGMGLGSPYDTQSGLKSCCPALLPHHIANTCKCGNHAGCSSGNGCNSGIQSDEGCQPPWCSREKASVDLLRDIDKLLGVTTGRMHHCVTKHEPGSTLDMGGTQHHNHMDVPTGLGESPRNIDELEGSDGFVLPEQGISADTDSVAGLSAGFDEAEVEQLVAVLLADIETCDPEAQGSDGECQLAARHTGWQLTGGEGVEGTANEPITAAQQGNEAKAEAAVNLPDVAKGGSAEPPRMPTACTVSPPRQPKPSSGSEEEVTPMDGRKSGRHTGRVWRNRNYHMPGKYRGVRCRREGRYSAELKVGNVRRWLITFPTAEEVARAFDEAAIEVSGSKAQLNFPPQERTGSDQARMRKRVGQASGRNDSPEKTHDRDGNKDVGVHVAGYSPTFSKQHIDAHGPSTPHASSTKHL